MPDDLADKAAHHFVFPSTFPVPGEDDQINLVIGSVIDDGLRELADFLFVDMDLHRGSFQKGILFDQILQVGIRLGNSLQMPFSVDFGGCIFLDDVEQYGSGVNFLHQDPGCRKRLLCELRSIQGYENSFDHGIIFL
jgi:hypothetical protein